MRWLKAPWRRTPRLEGAQSAAVAAYRALLEQPDRSLELARTRVVVVDVESSGLNPFRDRLISIGAIAVQDGLVRIDDCFEIVLRQEKASEPGNILVHGIGGSAQLAGRRPADALIAFLGYAGKAPLVGFHADFDRVLLQSSMAAVLGMKLTNPWLDLALVAPALHADKARSAHTLDDWLRVFGIENMTPHDASADALATAQLFLVLSAHAHARGRARWADLVELQESQRWLRRSGLN